MLTVERTDVVSVPVTDLERSIRFYGNPDGNTLMLYRRYAARES
jgi:catechol 2,3-dioxygenase-like lactoylglutathione lyase family enzyme